MRPAVRIEAHRQTVLREHLVQRPEGRGRAFLLDQKRRIDRPGRVVERHNQIERRLALEPGVPRAVLMQHHPRQRPTLALPPMRPLARRLLDNALPLQMQLRPGVAPAEAVVLHQMLVEVLDREALVALAIKPLHLLGPIDRNPLARRLAEPRSKSPASPSPRSAASIAGTSARSTPSNSAASSWLSSAGSQRCRRFKNLAMRTPSRASVRRIQTPPKRAGSTGQIVRYLNRTYRVLPTIEMNCLAIIRHVCYSFHIRRINGGAVAVDRRDDWKKRARHNLDRRVWVGSDFSIFPTRNPLKSHDSKK